MHRPICRRTHTTTVIICFPESNYSAVINDYSDDELCVQFRMRILMHSDTLPAFKNYIINSSSKFGLHFNLAIYNELTLLWLLFVYCVLAYFSFTQS